MYSSPNCGCSDSARDYFVEHDIEFVEYNVEADSQRLYEMLDYSAGSRRIPSFVEYGVFLGSGWGDPPNF